MPEISIMLNLFRVYFGLLLRLFRVYLLLLFRAYFDPIAKEYLLAEEEGENAGPMLLECAVNMTEVPRRDE